MTNKYYKLMALIVFLVCWVGFVGPYCISGATEFVLGYIFVSIIIIPFIIKFIKRSFFNEKSN